MNHIKTNHQPFKCNKCSESFEIKEVANTHKRVKHPNIRPVEASRGAELQETRKEGQEETSTVTEQGTKEYRFECPICGLTKTTKK